MTENDDLPLRARFAALRHQDAERAPPFEAVVGGAPPRRPTWVPVLAAASATAALILGFALRSSVESQPVDVRELALPPWPLATAALAEVVEVHAFAIDPALPFTTLDGQHRHKPKEDR
jgi:hypothetical protein